MDWTGDLIVRWMRCGCSDVSWTPVAVAIIRTTCLAYYADPADVIDANIWASWLSVVCVHPSTDRHLETTIYTVPVCVFSVRLPLHDRVCHFCLKTCIPCHPVWCIFHINSLERKGNYSATSNNMKLLHWLLMGGLLHLVQRGGDWMGPQPAQALLAVPNVTAHPSTASAPITVLLYIVVRCCAVLMCPLEG